MLSISQLGHCVSQLNVSWIVSDGNTKGGSIGHLFDWFGISCRTTDNFCFNLQKRLIQTSQTGG